MPPVKKIVKKMQNQPHGIRIDEADKVLGYYGYKLDRTRGSHRQYINAVGDVITVQEKHPSIDAVYVKDILSRLPKEKIR